MAKTLKEIFGLREMSVEVPEKDIPALRRAISHAVRAGTLPPAAKSWVPKIPKDAAPASEPPASKGQATTPSEPVPAQPRPASTGKALGGWAAWKAQNPTTEPVNPARSTPKELDPDLDGEWFQNDKPARKKGTPPPIPAAALKKKDKAPAIPKQSFFNKEKPLAPDLPAPKPASVKMGKGAKKPPIDWSKDQAMSGEFPDLPAPQSAAAPAHNDDDYKSPFGSLGLGSTGGSAWDNVPDWARDPEKMPHAGGGSMRIPGSPADNPYVGDKPGKLPKTKKGPSPVGAPWQDKKPGMLSRLFGKKGSK